MLKVVVLGSNSFIGKHLIRHLAEKKDVSLTLFGKTRGPEFENLNFVQGDFEDSESLSKALRGQDLVYHFISPTIPASSWNAPLMELDKNLRPFMNFLELAGDSRIKKICFASSGGTVYGLQEDLLTEDHSTEPFSPHGIIKRTTESFLQYAKHRYGITYDIYRMSNVYGEGQDVGKGLGFINTALENITNHRPVLIYGTGENVRDYIYVKDVSKLLALSLKKDLNDSDIYNISSNHPISLNELIELMKKVLGFDFEVKYLPKRMSDNQKVVLSNTKIMQYFARMILTSLDEGITKTYNYLRKQEKFVKKSI
jgi:UDP-glucose 4-epimerase